MRNADWLFKRDAIAAVLAKGDNVRIRAIHRQWAADMLDVLDRAGLRAVWKRTPSPTVQSK